MSTDGKTWYVVRPAFCGHYTETISFGPMTEDEARAMSEKSGRFGEQDCILNSAGMTPYQRMTSGIH